MGLRPRKDCSQTPTSSQEIVHLLRTWATVRLVLLPRNWRTSGRSEERHEGLQDLSASHCLAEISQGPDSQAFTKEMRTKERTWVVGRWELDRKPCPVGQKVPQGWRQPCINNKHLALLNNAESCSRSTNENIYYRSQKEFLAIKTLTFVNYLFKQNCYAINSLYYSVEIVTRLSVPIQRGDLAEVLRALGPTSVCSRA